MKRPAIYSRSLCMISTRAYALLEPDALRFLDASVSASVVSISPSNPEHINKTFAFCRSVGLEKTRVQLSIADGCFRSLEQFATHPQVSKYLNESGKPITRKDSDASRDSNALLCPFYEIANQPFVCRFTQSAQSEVKDIRTVCMQDKSQA